MQSPREGTETEISGYPERYASISPTGLETAQLCLRKYAWRKVCGLESPGSPSTLFGQAVHKMLEDHVRIGRPFDFTHAPKVAECAEALRILLAKQVPHYMTGEPERKFECPIDLNPGSEWGYGGTVDLTVPPPPDAGHFGWQGWTIVDYKSTSSIEKWAKTAAVLRTDAQPIVYGFEFYARHPEVDTVRFLWLYVERESRKTLPVQIFLTRSEVVRGAMRLRRDIDRMRGIRYGAPELGVHTEKTIAYVNSLPYNSSACGAFGGCEYVGNCRLSVREMMGGQAPIGAAELVRR